MRSLWWRRFSWSKTPSTRGFTPLSAEPPTSGDRSGRAHWLENARASREYGTWGIGYAVGEPRRPVTVRWTGQMRERVILPAGTGGQLSDIAFS
jgi:hypothetical protein